jgi:putative membrane protein
MLLSSSLLPLHVLPLLNAFLNSLSAVLLCSGYIAIRRRCVLLHKTCMLTACFTSALFLISYLTYHYHVGSKPFTGQGSIRLVYFTILISHTILAVVIVPLVVLTLTRAWKAQWIRHQRLARWTLPLWLYVSVTGVVIYLMLYQLYPVS